MKKKLYLSLIAVCMMAGMASAQERKPFEGTITTKISYYIQQGAAGAGNQVMIQKIKGKKAYAVTKADTQAEFNRSLYDYTDPQNAVAYAVVRLPSGEYAAFKYVFPYDASAMEPVIKLMTSKPTETIGKFGYQWDKKIYKDDARILDGYISQDFYQAIGIYEAPISYSLLSDMKLNGASYTSSTTELLDFKPEPIPDNMFQLPDNTRVFDNVNEWTNYVLIQEQAFRTNNPEGYKEFEKKWNKYLDDFNKMSKSEETTLPENLWDF